MSDFSRTYTHTLGPFTLTGDEKGGLVLDHIVDVDTEERMFQISEVVGGWRICGYFPEAVARKVRDELLALTDWTVGPDALKKVDGLRDKVREIADANGEDYFR